LKTINIVNTGTSAIVGDSQLLSTASITDTALTSVAISGVGALTLGAFGTAPTTVTVTGTVGFTGYIAGASTSFDASGSTGVVTVYVGATDVTKTIKGSTATGNEIVFGGAGSSVYSGTGKVTTTNVTGFTTLGLTASAAGTWDMSKFAGYTSIDIINNAAKTNGYQFAAAGNGSFTFTNVVAGTNVQIQGTNTGNLSYTTTDTNGSGDSVTLTIGNSGNTSTAAIVLSGTITLQDSNSTGLGTVNIVTNAGTSTSNTVAFGSLADTNISVLNISGTGGLAANDTTAYSDSANSLVINNTTSIVPASVAPGIVSNFAVNLYGISDSSLGSLTFNGTNSTYVGTLTDGISNVGITSNSTANVAINTFVANTSSATGSVNVITFNGSGNIDIGTLTSAALTLTLKNSGTGTVTVGDGLGVASNLTSNFTALTDTTFTTLNLTGNIAYGTNATVLTSAATANTTTYSTTAVGNAAGSSSGTLTVSGATDNAHVNIRLTPNTSSGTVVHSITLGNGNDYITDLSTYGTVNVTVGTGYNLIDVGAGANSSFNSTITLGAHSSTTTAYDLIETSVLNGYSGPYVANTVISGISGNDELYVGSNANNYSSAGVGYIKTLTSNQLSTAAAYSTASGAVNYVQSLSIGANTVAVFNWGSNTYLLADAVAGENTLQNGDSLIELIGTHTISSTISATGIVVIAS